MNPPGGLQGEWERLEAGVWHVREGQGLFVAGYCRNIPCFLSPSVLCFAVERFSDLMYEVI